MNDPQHHWAAYDAAGNVLETFETPNKASYHLYKAKLDGEVGPWPDRDRPMLERKTVCHSCEGTATQEGHSTCQVDDLRNPIIKLDVQERVDPTRELEYDKCYRCAGTKYQKRNGYGHYRTPSSLKAAITRGNAVTCQVCDGRGEMCHVPTMDPCRQCDGTGATLTWDATRPVLPHTVDRCSTATRDFMQAWLEDITITVVRDTVGMSWGEAHLGFAGLGSRVDYGRSWQASDDEIIQDVIDAFVLSGVQYTKLIDPHTHVFGVALVIRVTPQGVTPLVFGAPLVRTEGLPPTYFPTVFQEA
jgi:hypothetical protein